jgi:integrase
MVRAMLMMGMRSEETIKMKWAGYRPDILTYYPDLTKNNEASAMPIPPLMMEWFEKCRAERDKTGILSPYICPSPRDPSKPRAKTTVTDLLDVIAKKMELGAITRHRLRASFATMLHQANVPVKTIQKLMRHKRIETTMTYIEVESSELQDAVNTVFA